MFDIHRTTSRAAKAAALGLCALAMGLGAAPAEAQHRGGGGFHGGAGFHSAGPRGPAPGWHRPAPVYHGRGGGWGPGWVLGGIGLGLGIAAASSYYYSPYYGYTYAPPAYYTAPAVVDPAYVAPSVNPGAPQYVPSDAAPGSSTQGSVPAPIFYPRNGQSAEQTELDRQDCNRWASSQQNALNDTNVFQRATLACMDGRGYTVR